MNTVKGFIKTHIKKFIVGAILFVVTFGGYGLYKVFTNKEES